MFDHGTYDLQNYMAVRTDTYSFKNHFSRLNRIPTYHRCIDSSFLTETWGLVRGILNFFKNAEGPRWEFPGDNSCFSLFCHHSQVYRSLSLDGWGPCERSASCRHEFRRSHIRLLDLLAPPNSWIACINMSWTRIGDPSDRSSQKIGWDQVIVANVIRLLL